MTTVLDAGHLRRLGIEPVWSRFVNVSLAEGVDVRVHALDAGPSDGRQPPLTVVCVHGNPTWSLLWRSFHRRLGDRYRVLAIDQVSMGLSERTGPRAFAERVDDLGRILTAFEVDGPVVLAAHDWGGPIALGWALDYPERVLGILLTNTGVASLPSGVPLPIRLARNPLLRDAACRRTSAFARAALVTARGRLDKDVRAAYLHPYRTADDRRAIEQFVADIPTTPLHPSHAALARVAGRLGELGAVPLLLAWGDGDPVFHPGFAADLLERLPQAELHRFPLAGHLVLEEEDVAGVADSWIDRLLEPRRAARHEPAPIGGAVAATRLWSALVDREHEDVTAVVDGAGQSLTFRQLAARVAAAAEGLREAGVGPGDRVALLAPDPLDFIVAAYACWVSGAVAVFVDRGLGLRGIGRALRSAGPKWLLGTRKTFAAARLLRWVPSARPLELAALRGGGFELSAVAERLAPAPGALAAVAFTSGATGPAKGVLYDQARMAAQFSAVRDRYGIDRDDRLVAAFAPFALYGPALGIPVAVPDCDITEPASLQAEALARACAAVEATIVFAAPAALDGVLGSQEKLTSAGRHALGKVRLVLSAGAPVPRETLQSFGRLAPTAELHTPYGMTEIISVADIDLVTLDAVGPGHGVCVGQPLPGVGLRIDPFPDSETGEIVVTAPWLSLGYDGLWATTAKARTFDDHGVEWHRTGDVGHLDHEGRLWVEGRLAHVVSTPDGPVTPVPLEVAVTAATGLRCAVTGVGPSGAAQVVVVVVDDDAKPGLAADAVERSVREAIGSQPVAAVLTVRRLPVDRRHNSKVDRTRLGQWAGQLLAGGRIPRRI